MAWTEPILHVDMDSFFVEVERLRDPSLRGIPVAVGGVGRRGVVASASYEARRFGVRSAQATSEARRVCPELVVVPSDHSRYSSASESVFAVFRSVSPLVEGLSLDEAFVDVSGLRRHFDNPSDVGEHIRARLKSELGLPSSVGVAAVKFVAKLASEEAKPDGLFHVPSEDQAAFLAALEVERMWGVGPATLAALERLGVRTVGDLREIDPRALDGAVGSATSSHLYQLAHGIDPRPVVPDSKAKSVSVEQTYERDLLTSDEIESALLRHSQRLAGRLRRAGLKGRTIALKIRFNDFKTLNRSKTLGEAIDGSRELYKVAVVLADSVAEEGPVRLLGLGATGLERAADPRQLNMATASEWESIEDAVAEVRDRYGDSSVLPARLLDRDTVGKLPPQP